MRAIFFAVCLWALSLPVFAIPVTDSNGRTVGCKASSGSTQTLNCSLTIPAGNTNGAIPVGVHTDAAVTGLTVDLGGVPGTEVASTAASQNVNTRMFCLPSGSTTGAVTITATWTSAATYGAIDVWLVSGASNQVTPCANGTTSTAGFNTAVSKQVTCTTADLAINFVTMSAGGVIGVPTSSSQKIGLRGNPNIAYGSSYVIGTNPTFGWPNTSNGWSALSGACVTGAATGTADTNIHAVCMGDSIMEGWNSARPPGYLSPNDGGPAGSTDNDINTQVQAYSNNTPITCSNYGISGAQIAAIAGELNTAIDNGEHPTWVVMDGGINNIAAGLASGAAFSTTQANFDATMVIVTALGATLINEEVWPSGLDVSTVSGTRTSTKAWNADLATWVAANIAGGKQNKLLLMYVRMGTGDNLNTAYAAIGDTTHPNSVGVVTHAKAIVKSITSCVICFSSSVESGYKTASASYTFYIEPGETNRACYIGVSMLSVGGATVSSITTTGGTLTQLGAVSSGAGAIRAELWELPAPVAINQTITITLSAALDSAASGICLSGVNQGTAHEGTATATATNIGAADATVNVVSVANNDWFIGVVATDDTAITPSLTSRSNTTGTLGSGSSESAGPKTPAGTQAVGWTNVAALATWATVATGVIGASGTCRGATLLGFPGC